MFIEYILDIYNKIGVFLISMVFISPFVFIGMLEAVSDDFIQSDATIQKKRKKVIRTFLIIYITILSILLLTPSKEYIALHYG